MVAYTYAAPAGVPGDVTRVDESNVETKMLQPVSSVYAQAFGIPMVYDPSGGGIQQFGASNVAADFAGILIREAPSISGNFDSTFNGAVPNPVQPQGFLVRGYAAVICTYGTPVGGGVVYVRTVANSNNEVVGSFDATSDAGNNVALSLTQASWASDGKDSNNICEIRVAR